MIFNIAPILLSAIGRLFKFPTIHKRFSAQKHDDAKSMPSLDKSTANVKGLPVFLNISAVRFPQPQPASKTAAGFILFMIFVVAFSYFYTFVTIKPKELSENLNNETII